MTRGVRIAAIALAALHAVILGAGLFAPYPYDEQHRDYPYAPPSRLHFVNAAGRLHLRPFACRIEQQLPSELYREDCSRTGEIFLLGTDGLGRDILSRVLYGGRISILSGLLATLIALGIGAFAGLLSGFYGGWTDRLLMRFGELFLALPWLYLLLAARALLPLHISPLAAFCLVVAIIGTMGWVRPARLVRGVVLSTRERGYVLAARGFGASGGHLIRRHILPSVWGIVLTQATLLIPQFIRAEVTLSFLGLGISEPAPSWGNMLTEARQYYALVSHPWLLAPGLALIPLLLGYFWLADGLLSKHQEKSQ